MGRPSTSAEQALSEKVGSSARSPATKAYKHIQRKS
jgi:hypothetical protein